MFDLEISRRWGLVTARARIRFIIERIQTLLLGLGNDKELRRQKRQFNFYYS
jgi:hypothetical protein